MQESLHSGQPRANAREPPLYVSPELKGSPDLTQLYPPVSLSPQTRENQTINQHITNRRTTGHPGGPGPAVYALA